MAKYGKEHYEAKKAKIAEVKPKCQITGEYGNMEGHHIAPKSFTGPDLKNNYMILKDTFHTYLHQCINVTGEDQLFYRRLGLAKKLWNNPVAVDNEETKKKIEEIDQILIPKYIDNMMSKLAYSVREKVINLTLQSNYHTIRDLNIKVHELETKLKNLTSEKELILSSNPGKITMADLINTINA